MSSSCGPTEEEINAEARLVYEQRVTEFKAKKAKECKIEAMKIAEIEVDSILAREAADPLNDSPYHPDIPGRPDFVPIDSSVFNSKRSVKPILE